VTSVIAGVNDQFLACLCEFGLELCHLGLTLSPKVGRDVIEALIQTAPSLKTLSVAVIRQTEQSKSSSDGNTCDLKDLDENYFIKIVRQYHGGHCYCNVYKQTSSRTKQFALSFTPLKFLTAGGLEAEI
jgi:hypothetical protein